MLNLMKADVYRIFKGKGVYITFGIYVALIVLQVATGIQSAIGVNTSSEIPDMSNLAVLTGKEAPLKMMGAADNIIYFILPLIVFVVGTDFSSGTIKNTLSNGMSRTKYYLSKLLLTFLLCVIMAVLSVVASMLIGTIVNGFGGSIDGEYIMSILKPFLMQLVLLLATTSVGVFLVFLTQKTAGAISAYLAFCMIPTLVIFMITDLIGMFKNLVNYDIVLNLRSLATMDAMTSGEINRALLIGVCYLALSIAGGIVMFNKRDIK